MTDTIDTQRSFVVGAVQDLSKLERDLAGLDASVRTWGGGEGGSVLVVTTPLRHAEDIARRVGPNAQILDDEAKARAVAEAAAAPPAGRPHEPPG